MKQKSVMKSMLKSQMGINDTDTTANNNPRAKQMEQAIDEFANMYRNEQLDKYIRYANRAQYYNVTLEQNLQSVPINKNQPNYHPAPPLPPSPTLAFHRLNKRAKRHSARFILSNDSF
ncbi:hypothetical protein ACHAWO_010123 [Cyclotella atomus]|uniref:Uncharacterized protein n=1 Tax=Cyclotella atomus TaxID=382360 RepID=A0ABD3NDG2_9STRA